MNRLKMWQKIQIFDDELRNQNGIHDEVKNMLNSGNACHYSVQNLLSSGLI
jgi:hypothetical protein